MLPTASHSVGRLDACLQRVGYGRAFKDEFMGANANLPTSFVQPFLDFVGLFERLQIGYALIGGIATMYYGLARFTEDVDFVAASGHQQVLEQSADVMREFHFDPPCPFRVYHTSGVEIDLWKDEFCDEIVKRSRTATLAGRSVRIADPNDLAAMKLSAGRIQDDYDISELIRARAIDESVLRSLVPASEFDRYLQIKSRVSS